MAIPDFIKETTNKIRHAVIGGEITNTIADGLEKIAGVANDSTDTTKEIEEYIKTVELGWNSDPNKDPEIITARGGETQLKDRFEKTDAQLAHKASKDEVIERIEQVVSGSPKGTYSTLSALQTAFPAGTSGVYITSDNGNWYFWNGSVWTSGGLYQSSGIADESIKFEKISEDYREASNVQPRQLFSGTVTGSVSSTNGTLTNETDAGRLATDFIPIDNIKPIYTNWLKLLTPKALSEQTLVFYDENKTFLESRVSDKEVMPPSNARFVRQNLKVSAWSVDPTQYIMWQGIESVLKKEIDGITSALSVTLKNSFTGETFQGSTSSTTGTVTETHDSTRLTTGFMEIDPAKKMKTNFLELLTPEGAINSQVLVFFDMNKNYLGSITSFNSEVMPPPNARFVRQNLKVSAWSVDPELYSVTQENVVFSNEIEAVKDRLDTILSDYGIDTYKSKLFFPYDFVDGVSTDSEVINKCLDFASVKKERVIVFDRKDWHIDEAILLPANTTVVVNGVTIKQNDGVFDNVFRGDNLVIDETNPYHYPLSITPIEHVYIYGVNGAKIEGPDVNKRGTHPSQGEQDMVGDFWGWRTLQISLSKCSNFEVAGFKFRKQRCWAISFDKCSNFKAHNLEFDSSVKNGDGVNVRFGCHDFEVYDIKGSTSDDSVAINTINYFPSGNYVYPMEPSAFENNDLPIGDLFIRDGYVGAVHTTGQHHGVICLANSGRKIFDILISDIKETSKSNRESVVKIYSGYGSGYNADDIHGIRVNDVVSKGASHAVQVTHKVGDVWINKVVQENVNGNVTLIADLEGITVTNS